MWWAGGWGGWLGVHRAEPETGGLTCLLGVVVQLQCLCLRVVLLRQQVAVFQHLLCWNIVLWVWGGWG
jgi:hypothetical protein